MKPDYIFPALLPIIFLANHYWIFGLSGIFHYNATNFEENGVLWKVRQKVEDKLGWHWTKPLLACPPCMASVHSSYFYWTAAIIIGFELYMIPLYILYAVCLSGLNRLKTDY